jgi:hypothetical protein
MLETYQACPDDCGACAKALNAVILYYGDDMTASHLTQTAAALKSEFEADIGNLFALNVTIFGVVPLAADGTLVRNSQNPQGVPHNHDLHQRWRYGKP